MALLVQKMTDTNKFRGRGHCTQPSNVQEYICGGVSFRYFWLICPNISTTPLHQRGFRLCLPLSWTTLRGKHCRHSIAVMGVQICSGHVNNLFRLQTPIILYPLIWHVMFLAFSHVALFVWNTKYKLIQYNSFNCWCCVFPPPNLSFPISLH